VRGATMPNDLSTLAPEDVIRIRCAADAARMRPVSLPEVLAIEEAIWPGSPGEPMAGEPQIVTIPDLGRVLIACEDQWIGRCLHFRVCPELGLQIHRKMVMALILTSIYGAAPPEVQAEWEQGRRDRDAGLTRWAIDVVVLDR
jgi:hypothetical protein